MNFEEHAGKAVLRAAGLAVPDGRLCDSPEAVRAAVVAIGPAVVKAQVAAGKRGKSGGIRAVDGEEEAVAAARALLGMRIGEYRVERVLVEQRADIAREFYAAVLNDAASRSPLVLFSTQGGMDIEDIAVSHPQAIHRQVVAIERGFDADDARRMLSSAGLGDLAPAVAEFLARLYRVYRERDAELLEINPLACLADGRLVALDCKLSVDDAALYRQPDLAAAGAPEPLTELERRGREAGLRYMEFEGNVGVLANGAGLTMTTMDVIRHFGGHPANFLEIGGEAYTKATAALELVLANPGVKSLVINFCGAFARTDVMADGVVNAWETLRPSVPVFFSIFGTGEEQAIRLVRERLGVEPFDSMEGAVQAAVEAAR